ncbi:MAG: hypothetical protein DMF67_10815 [Acidobacteria bacterium]|nr:MAG: hypothetical protein DMF67_10815 [Acidobacteriota bacterium]
MTTERRWKLRGARHAGARRLPLCALALLFMCAPQVFAQDKPPLPAQEATVESLLTNAGTLAIVRIGEEMDAKMELRLKGRKVYAIEGNMSAGFVAQFRTNSSGELIVMTVSEGGTACPAQFQIVHVEDTGKVSVTDEFGDCGDSPTITLQLIPDEQVTLRFQGYYRLSEEQEPGFKKPPPSTWVYKRGVLNQLSPAPPKRRGK